MEERAERDVARAGEQQIAAARELQRAEEVGERLEEELAAATRVRGESAEEEGVEERAAPVRGGVRDLLESDRSVPEVSSGRAEENAAGGAASVGAEAFGYPPLRDGDAERARWAPGGMEGCGRAEVGQPRPNALRTSSKLGETDAKLKTRSLSSLLLLSSSLLLAPVLVPALCC